MYLHHRNHSGYQNRRRQGDQQHRQQKPHRHRRRSGRVSPLLVFGIQNWYLDGEVPDYCAEDYDDNNNGRGDNDDDDDDDDDCRRTSEWRQTDKDEKSEEDEEEEGEFESRRLGMSWVESRQQQNMRSGNLASTSNGAGGMAADTQQARRLRHFPLQLPTTIVAEDGRGGPQSPVGHNPTTSVAGGRPLHTSLTGSFYANGEQQQQQQQPSTSGEHFFRNNGGAPKSTGTEYYSPSNNNYFAPRPPRHLNQQTDVYYRQNGKPPPATSAAGGGGGGMSVQPAAARRPVYAIRNETTTTAANNYQYQQPPPPQRIRSGTGQQPQQYSNNNGMLQPQQLVVVANGKPRRTEGGRKSSSGGGGGSGGLKVLCCCFGLKPKTKRGATTIAQPQNQGLASQTTVVQTATQQQQPQPIYIQHQEYRQQQQQNGNGNNYGHPQQQQQLARYAPQHLAPESLITQVTKDDPTTTTTPTSNGGGRLAEALAVSLNGFSINNGASAQQQQQISPLPAPSPYSPKPGDPVLLGPPRSLDSNLKCLVIDLDETLVHSSFKPVKAADFVLPVEIDGVVHQVYVLKRPHVDAFLDHVSRRFECVLFTASLAKYADPVADLLDGGRGVFRARLFREACVMHRGNYVKDLSRLGRPLERVAIIDNSPVSYVFHPANALPVQTWFDDPSDRELLALMPTLDQLHRAQTVYDVLAPQATQQQPMRIASPPPPPLHQNGHGAGNNPLTALLSPAPPPASKMVMVGKAN